MKIEGKIEKSGNCWAVSVPLLLVFSQGKTKKLALSMIQEAVEGLVDVKGFKVNVTDIQANTFSISASNTKLLMAFILKQQRLRNKKSIRQVAKKLGSSSPTAYSQYEQAKTNLNMDKFIQVLSAINEKLEPILRLPDKAI